MFFLNNGVSFLWFPELWVQGGGGHGEVSAEHNNSKCVFWIYMSRFLSIETLFFFKPVFVSFVSGRWQRREWKSVHHIFPFVPSVEVG